MYCSTSSTPRQQILLEALRMWQTQAMTVSWLQLVTGDYRGAAILSVLSVSQVSIQSAISLSSSSHHHCNAVILKIRNSAIPDKPRDAFRGQSRSPNMVPFHVLGMVSYLCAIVTLSPRRAFFRYSTLKMPRPWYPGQRSLKVIESGTFDR